MRLLGFAGIGCCGHLGRGHFRILRGRIRRIGIGFVICKIIYQKINHLERGGTACTRFHGHHPRHYMQFGAQ